MATNFFQKALRAEILGGGWKSKAPFFGLYFLALFFAVKPEECPKQNGQSTPQTLQCGVDLLVKDIRDQGVSGTKISFLKEEDRRLAGLYRYCKE